MSGDPSVAPGTRSIERSRELQERANRVVPGGSQTGSKSPTQFVQGVSPTHLERGKGCRVWDVDGNEYIDHTMSLGPVTLGHDYPAVTRAVERQLANGTMFTLEHPLHVEVAELFTEVVPCAEMVQFAKNGNDVTSLAAKLARAHTGRDVVATFGYHGWPDVWMSSHSNLDRGIPNAVGEYTERFEYNDIASLERIFDAHPADVAAVVMVAAHLEAPRDDFLERVRELCDEHDTILVYDEVLTGFRFSLGGAQEYFGVTPDLACFAKGMANGYPIAALAGREDVMTTLGDDDFMFSTTYSGEALSLAAAKAAITVQRSEPVHEHLWEQGEKIQNGIGEMTESLGLDSRVSVPGFAPHSTIAFTDGNGDADAMAKSLFMQECHERGVLFAGSHLPCYSHTDEDIEETLSVYETALTTLADAIDTDDVASRLDGSPVGATLRQRTGEED